MSVAADVREARSGARPVAVVSGAQQSCRALLTVAALYWGWLAVAGRTITTDPGISVLAAQSILERGYPLLPSGFLYPRAYVQNYALALSIKLLGLNDFSVALPSLLMAVGSLYLTYLIARDVLRRPWLGVLAVAVMLAMKINSHYAASPRMYMPLQFFTLLSIYAAWRGYFEGSARFRMLTVVAVACAFLTHQQGGIMTLAIPFGVVAARWLAVGRLPTLKELRPLAGVTLLAPLYMMLLRFDFPRVIRPIAMDGYPGGMSGLSLNPRAWMSHANWLEHTVPLGIFLAPAMVWLAVRELRHRRDPDKEGLRFLLLMFATWSAGVLGYIRVEGTRFWVGIAPIYVLLLLESLSLVLRAPVEPPNARRRLATWTAVLAAWGVTAVAGYTWYYGPGEYFRRVRDGWGPPCADQASGCSTDIEAEYRSFASKLGPSDLVLTTDPFVANYYLGKVDGWLLQRVGESGFGPISGPIDEYFGIQLVDREAELLALLEDPRRVWVILENTHAISEELADVLRASFHAVDQPGPFEVFVNRQGTQ